MRVFFGTGVATIIALSVYIGHFDLYSNPDVYDKIFTNRKTVRILLDSVVGAWIAVIFMMILCRQMIKTQCCSELLQITMCDHMRAPVFISRLKTIVFVSHVVTLVPMIVAAVTFPLPSLPMRVWFCAMCLCNWLMGLILFPIMYIIPELSLNAVEFVKDAIDETDRIDWRFVTRRYCTVYSLVNKMWAHSSLLFAIFTAACFGLGLLCSAIAWVEVDSSVHLSCGTFFGAAFYIILGLTVLLPPSLITSRLTDANPMSGSVYASAFKHFGYDNQSADEEHAHSRFMHCMTSSQVGVRVFGIVVSMERLARIATTLCGCLVYMLSRMVLELGGTSVSRHIV